MYTTNTPCFQRSRDMLLVMEESKLSIKILFMPKFTFSHLGAKNSFPVKPISAFDNGESQNPHFNQLGMDAVAVWPKNVLGNFCLIVEGQYLAWSLNPWNHGNALQRGMMKPPNRRMTSNDIVPPTEPATIVWQ